MRTRGEPAGVTARRRTEGPARGCAASSSESRLSHATARRGNEKEKERGDSEGGGAGE